MPSEKHFITVYGFLAKVELLEEGNGALDLFVPEELADHLQFRAGSTFIYQSVEPTRGNADYEGQVRQPSIFLRPKTGIEVARGDRKFAITVRFPNKPGQLNSFLKESHACGISYRSIKTFGYRGADDSDLIFEGCMTGILEERGDFSKSSSLDRLINAVARKCQAELMGSDSLCFASQGTSGQVGGHQYILDLPVVGGRFRRLRLASNSSVLLARLHEISLVRLVANFGTGSLEVDCNFCLANHYIITANCSRIDQAAPLTHYILRSLDPRMNVDAVSGAEFYGLWNGSGKKAPPPGGRLELLCTSAFLIDEQVQNEKVLLQIGQHTEVDAESVEVLLLQTALNRVAQELVSRKRADIREDVVYKVLRRQLDGGRYAFVEKLDSGYAPRSSKYLDLKHSRMVVVRMFDFGEVVEDELVALERYIADRKSFRRANILEPDRIFRDEMQSFLVADCPDFYLEEFFSGRFNERYGSLRRPQGLEAFLGLATQLLNGLRDLQSVRRKIEEASLKGGGDRRNSIESRRGLFRQDIVPANIGGIWDSDQGLAVWKIIYYGLSRRDRVGNGGGGAAGAREFTSPQVFKGAASLSDDIYSLGIVLFEVICRWKHPSCDSSGGRIYINSSNSEMTVPIEVAEKFQGEDSMVEFGFENWSPDLDVFPMGYAVEEEMRRILYRMISLDRSRRYRDVEEILADIQYLRSQAVSHGASEE